MMDLSKLENAGKEIENRLIVIRERIGAKVGAFNVAPSIMVTSGDKLKNLAQVHPNEPIIIDDEPYVVYIRDHDYHGLKYDHDRDIRKNPAGCFTRGNKVHFYFCSALADMSKKGREARYHWISWKDDNNTKLIDLKDATGVQTRLPWCKFCLNILLSKRAPFVRNKDIMVENGDTQKLMASVLAYYNGNLYLGKQLTDDFRRDAQGDQHGDAFR